MKKLFLNKKIQLISFWVLLVLSSTIVSNCCNGKKNTYSSIFSIENRDYFSITDTIKADSFALYYVSKINQVASNIDFSLISKTYATQCYYTNLGKKETIADLKIFTNNYFDATHPAGAYIGDYFYHIFHHSPPMSDTFISLPNLEADLLAMNLYGRDNFISGDGFLDLYLKNRPAQKDTFSFRTEVRLTDGRLFSFNSATYVLY